METKPKTKTNITLDDLNQGDKKYNKTVEDIDKSFKKLTELKISK